MKYVAPILVIVFLLSGCTQNEKGVDQALQFREELIHTNGCQFETTVVADYLDYAYTFSMKCQTDANGNIVFSVLLPKKIAGITGTVSGTEGKLTFDDQVLMFAPLAEGQITPVGAPWIFMNALRCGYIKSCAVEETGVTLYIDDSYADNTMQVNIRMVNEIPSYCEIILSERVVVTLNVENFCFL